MDCDICRHHNEANAKFCSECGSPLALRCSTCDADQPPNAKFCNQCGSAMAGRPDAPSAVAERAVVPTAVRKQVTALFADLVGSTAFGERVDPEAARTTLAPYFEILRSTIEGHAGTVVKFTGDGVMAIFGVPEVAEDDALRAVAAGTELQRRFRAFADSVRDRHGIELGLRVGVNTGELVIGDDDADMVGDVLNTAARLEAACEPGRVMVGEDTWRLSRSAVRYEVLGEVRVKGKTDAVATFQVVDDAEAPTDDATPFVGRDDELGVLRSVFDDAVTARSARLVTVIGAPGVGKTRLAAEMRAAVDVRSFDLRFERRGSTTFTPIVDLLRELTRSGSAEDVARLVADHPEASRLAPVLASLLGHGDARTTEESFWAVRRLLEHLSTDEPLVVVVDDIQWAEPLFWDLLDHLVEWTAGSVLLVALARPELRDLRVELTQTGRRVAASIALEGLDADTTRELAARLLDTDELPRELVERIPDSTEGNPLFVRELVQMLVDDGVLALTGDRWHLTIDADAIEVPPTVLSLLASRVERLPDDERHVVELASVIGTEFDRGLLGAIAGNEIEARLGVTIDRLRRKDLIEPSGAWAGDQPIYRFHHVLVRDAAYRRLLKSHRADLHLRVGEYVDGLDGQGGDGEVVVAFHYEQVHRYRRELGTLDDATRELARDAARRLHSAARRTLDRDDPTAAGGFAERALALTTDPTQRGELLSLGCEALFAAGAIGRGAALVEAMDDHGDRDDRFEAWSDCYRAQLWSLTDADRLEEAELLADDAARRLDASDDLSGVAKARLVRAACLARLGRVGDCEDELDLALGAARAAGDRRRTVAVLGAAPLAALWGPSPVARAGGRCLDVLRLLRITTASPAVEATSVRCQGMLEALRGRLDSARTKLEQSRATAREIGLRQGLFETELFAGLVELLDGDPGTAEPLLRAAHDGLGRLGIGADAGQAAALLARSLLRQGRIDDADALAVEALDSAGQNLQTAMAARAVMAEVRSAQGRHDEASALVAEAIEIAERTDVIVDHALVELAAVVVAEAADDEAAASRHRTRAGQLLEAKGVTLGLAVDDGTDRQPASDRSGSPDDGSSVPENRATVVNDRVFRMGRVGDRDGWFDAHHDDAEIVFHMSLAESVFAHQTVDLETWAETTFGYPDDEELTLAPVAIRGEDLCLTLLDIRAADRRRSAYVLGQLDDGRISRVELFGSDELWDAIDRLDELWLGPASTVVGGTGICCAIASGDRTEILTVLADEFESVDHRQLGLVVRNREQYVESLMPVGEDPWIPVPVDILVHEEQGDHVVELAHLSIDVGDARIDHLIVGVTRGEHVVRADNFDLADERSARRRVEELVAESSWGTSELEADEPKDVELRNAASDLIAETVLLRTPADIERLRHRFHPDFVGRHRGRVFSAADDMDVDGWIEVVSSVLEVGGHYEPSVVAIRGDDLALSSVSFVVGDDVSERLVLVRLHDGLGVENIVFEADDLHDALDELDRLDVELHGHAELVELTQRCRHAQWDGDRDALRDLFAPGWRIDDRRSLGIGPVDRESYLRSSVRPGVTYVVQAILEQSNGVALARERWTANDGSRWDQLIVIKHGDGVLGSGVLFDPHDIRGARVVFDELVAGSFAAQGVSELENEAVRVVRHGQEQFAQGDRRAMEASLTDDFVCHSSRRFRTHDRLDRTAFIDHWLAVFQTEGTPTAVATTVLAVRGETLCLTEDAGSFGDATGGTLALHRVEDGRGAELWFFDQEDLQLALDELDRQFQATLAPVRRSHQLSNEATEVASRANDFFQAGDRAGFEALAHEDFVGHLHTRFRTVDEIDLDGFVDEWFSQFETSGPPTASSLTPTAIRGDTLCLAEIHVRFGDSVHEALAIHRVADGRIVEVWFYDREDIRQALDRLGQEYFDTFDTVPQSLQASNRIRMAMERGDRDGYRALLADDFVAVDHRRLGMGERTADEFAESLPQVDLVAATRQFLAVDESHVLGLVEFRAHGGESTVVMHSLTVVDPESHLISRLETFDESDEAAALDRFHELVDRGVRNDAVAVARRAHAIFKDVVWNGGERDALLALVHPAYVGHDLRDLRFTDRRNRDQFLAEWTDAFAFAGAPTLHEFEPIAVRGSSLCLARLSLEFGDNDLHRLFITRIEDGRVAEHWWFEPDALHDALDLLGQLPSDDVLAPIDATLERRYRRALASGTADDFREMVTDDYVMRDHRSLGMGVRDIDEYLESSGEHFGDTEFVVAEVVDREGPVTLSRITFRRSGFYQSADLHTLAIQVRRGEKIAVQESYEARDLDAARTRFRELATEHADDVHGGIGNRASELFAESHRRLRAGDPDRWREVFAEDFVATTRERLAPDPAPLGRDEYVRIVTELRGDARADDDSSSTSFDLLAVRGDHLCVVALDLVVADADVSKIFVVETNDESIVQYVVFDPDALHDALDLLSELWSPPGLDRAFARLEGRYRRVFASGTADDFRAMVSRDFEFRDHRKLGLGVRGLDEYVASSRDFFGCSQMIITDVIDWSGPVVLLRTTFRLPGDDQIADPQLLSVVVVRGDELAIQEPFDPDDLAAARARFHELVAEHPGAPPATFDVDDVQGARALLEE